MKSKKIKVIFLSAEIAPIAKVGGLGDVAGALPKALDNIGVDIRLFLPFYKIIDTGKYQIKNINKKIVVNIGGKTENASIWETAIPDTEIPVYLIKHPILETREIYSSGKDLVGNQYANDSDDLHKFVFFSKAAIEAAKILDFAPDIIHANDWHVSLAMQYIKNDRFFKKTKTVYTIHNLANQGTAGKDIINFTGLEKNKFQSLKISSDKKEKINLMAEGISTADIVTTVSPTYAKEILTEEFGAGLEKTLFKRKNNLYGILNGIDVDFFDPIKDEMIPANFSLNNLDKKTENKTTLQKKLGLRVNQNIPLFGMITRFVWQKGIELVAEEIASLGAQFVFLGTGEKKYEDFLKSLMKKFPEKISVQIKFDEKLAHEIYAGSDIFLVPSRFEPCGLTQMISMRYGSVPIVRKTGGLKDTVKNISVPLPDTKATGFVFTKFTSNELLKTIKSALHIYKDHPDAWKQILINGMKKDFSWKKSAKKYLRLYNKLIS